MPPMNHRLGRVTVLMIVASVLAASSLPRAIAHPAGPNPHTPNQTHPGGTHPRFDIPAHQPIPTVTVQVHPDPHKGWNLEIRTTHFTFAPEQLDRPTQWNAGHAHLYLNGQKLTRLYGPWYYLEHLPAGQVQVTVTLNTNHHQDLYHNGQRIEASTSVSAP